MKLIITVAMGFIFGNYYEGLISFIRKYFIDRRGYFARSSQQSRFLWLRE